MTVHSDGTDSGHSIDLFTVLRVANEAQQRLMVTRSADRSQGLFAMAEALKRAADLILEANTLDLEASRELELSPVMLRWLKLTPERLDRMVKILERLGNLPDPIRQAVRSPYPMHHCQSFSQLRPLGVVALVYEALPELGAIMAGMGIKTGNSVVLFGCREAKNTNRAIAQALSEGLAASKLPADCLAVLPSEQDIYVRDLVVQDRYLDLVIPYGRPKWVFQVRQRATVPVLQAAVGICYLYWASSGDVETVRWVVRDSHGNEPDAVNAVEKVLVSDRHSRPTVSMLIDSLQAEGFQVRGDEPLCREFPELVLAGNGEWRSPYLSKTVALRLVTGLDEALPWIRTNSSNHADCIVTESYQEAHEFALGLESASIHINASPRFQRNPRGSSSILLGMSNQKGYRRGPIGLESLTTSKQIIQGDGAP